MEIENQLDGVISSFNSLLEDSTIPKNLKTKIDSALVMLNSESELFLRISKVLTELEEISRDMNLSPHLRTQVWNLLSSLENITAPKSL